MEVNDELYRYFDSLKKQRRENRKSRQRIFEESHVYYDAYEGFTESPYFEDKSVNVVRQAEEDEFKRIVWNVVDKLEKEQRDIIVDRYINELDYVEIADKHGKPKSGISQLFDTLYHHLRILFISDEEFQKTDFAIYQMKEYMKELKSGFDEMKDEILGGVLVDNDADTIGDILTFSKKLKQEIKISEKIKITH